MQSEQQPKNAEPEFVLDIEDIRKRAREHLDKGAVTDDYQAVRQTIVKLLNDALATEIVCVLRYKRHAYMSANQGGIAGFAITKELAKHASEEQMHADRLAERIVQLGGEPDFDPASIIKRSHSQYVAGSSLREMITEDLVAERVAVEIYSKLIRYIGDKDATTRRLLEEILEQEEEHADELSDFGARLKMSGDNK